MELANIIRLLGRSERDAELQELLKQLGVDQPLPRIQRDESQVNIEIEGTPLELAFVDASESFPDDARYMEGELLLSTLFIHVPPSSHVQALQIPRGLTIPTSRAEARAIYGPPHWSSPVMKNDRWTFDDINVLLVFTADERSVKQVAISHAKS